MLAAILGTVGGDAASFGIGLWPAGTLLVFGVLATAMILVSGRRRLCTAPVIYWIIVALLRTAGTGGGDTLSQIGGKLMLSLGLGSADVPYYVVGHTPATIVSGAMFIALIWAFYGPACRRQIIASRP